MLGPSGPKRRRAARGLRGVVRVAVAAAVPRKSWPAGALRSWVIGSAVLLLAVWVADAGPAFASRWSVQSMPELTYPNGQLAAVSCSSPRACTAVGSAQFPGSQNDQGAALVERWNGRTWSLQEFPDARDVALAGVSCISARLCVAVGSSNSDETLVVARWKRGRWAIKHFRGITWTPASVSCASARACVAVGPGGIVQWNGRRWSTRPIPARGFWQDSPLSGVSCPSSRSCTAVGYYDFGSGCGDEPGPCTTRTLVVHWNGARWRIQRAPSPRGATVAEFTDVSCPSRGACLAVGTSSRGGFGEVWNGVRWSTLRAGLPRALIPVSMSCISRRVCTVLGTGSGQSGLVSARWNGARWSAPPLAMPAGATGLGLGDLAGIGPVPVGSLSCPSRGGCVAVGEFENAAGQQLTLAERWHRSRWFVEPSANVNVPFGGQRLTAVSCSSATACAAIESHDGNGEGAIEDWNGQAWSPSQVIGGYGISCLSAATCMVVGGGGTPLAELWNGQSASTEQTPNPAGATPSLLNGVSCTSVSACTAVGFAHFNANNTQTALAESWNGIAWTLQSAPNPGAGLVAPQGVSCVSPSTCVLVGNYAANATCRSGGPGPCTYLPLAEQWNGTDWTLQTMPTPAGGADASPVSVSCVSETDCVAVGSYAAGAQCGSGGACPTLALAESWNGTSWRVETVPSPPGARSAQLTSVSCLSASACVAVGTAEYNEATPLAEVWNGMSWTIQTVPTPSATHESALSGVSCTAPNACTAVGFFATSSDLAADLGEPLAERLS